MDYRRFNIHLKKAGGLDCKNQILKRPVYATVSIVGSSSIKQQTSEATSSAKNTSWGKSTSSLRFYVEETKLQCNCLVLMIQIFQKRLFQSDKVIGEVCVPLKELYDVSGGLTTTNHSFHQVVKPFRRKTTRLAYLYFTYEFGAAVIRGRDTNNDNGTIAAA